MPSPELSHVESKYLLIALSGLSTVCGAMALIIVNHFKGRIDSLETQIDKVDEKTQENTVAVGKAIDEPRVRDILHEELSDIRRTTKSTDDKVTQLMMAQLNTPTKPDNSHIALMELVDAIKDMKDAQRNERT